MYGQGMSINALSRALDQSYGQVRAALETAGVTLRSRFDSYRRGSQHPTAKLSVESKTRLVEELHVGEKQHRQLADEYGITRERVRQIAQASKAPCGREIQKKLAKQREAAHSNGVEDRKRLRQEQRDARHQEWRELWAQGLPLIDMAAKLGLSPASIGVRITELRQLHPDWFPYRHVPSALRSEPPP
jgi:molybdenum-dependent DNA-binding transcriptional regulator ModE